ncbi:hypothetical protein SNEBB_008435 [Seison nebaliae]|nr:hypothetical protein SNEBB_008435 [Seison nebaliae]
MATRAKSRRMEMEEAKPIKHKTINNLPNEILMRIFSYLLDDKLVVEQVCSKWKYLVNSPLLWRSISITPNALRRVLTRDLARCVKRLNISPKNNEKHLLRNRMVIRHLRNVEEIQLNNVNGVAIGKPSRSLKSMIFNCCTISSGLESLGQCERIEFRNFNLDTIIFNLKLNRTTLSNTQLIFDNCGISTVHRRILTNIVDESQRKCIHFHKQVKIKNFICPL